MHHDTVYRLIEIVGSSQFNLEDAIAKGIAQAKQEVGDLCWFKITEIRGFIHEGQVQYYQVGLQIGYHWKQADTLPYINPNKLVIEHDSPAKDQQTDFIAEGGNSQPLI